MTARASAAFHPGEFLAEELDARGWSRTEFAEMIGCPAQLVFDVVSGEKDITRDTAVEIAAALGTSSELWFNLQDCYERWLSAQA